MPSTELEKALTFCYALLGPGQDANAILAQNPERAKQAHRAIYEYRHPEGDYDAMMQQMASLTLFS